MHTFVHISILSLLMHSQLPLYLCTSSSVFAAFSQHFDKKQMMMMTF